MQLIYRGEQIEYQPSTARPHRKPYAINWRYRTPGEDYTEPPQPQYTRQPRALNWRWQPT